MKGRFTPFQIVLLVVDLFLFVCCILADIVIISADAIQISSKVCTTNLVLSAMALLVFLLLFFKAGSINIFGEEISPDDDTTPAITAMRTYFCMLAFDFGGVMTLMLAGSLFYQDAKYAIMIFAPSVFVLSAIVYFVRAGRIGMGDFEQENSEQSENSEAVKTEN